MPWLSFGSAVKRFSSNSNTQAALGKSVSGFDLGTSVSFAVPGLLEAPVQIGITSDNLVHKAENEPYSGPRQVGIGVKANLNKLLMLYGDVVENYSRFSGAYPLYSGGAEIAMAEDLFVRGGLFGYHEKGWSAGAGWIGPKLGVSYGYQSKKALAERSFEHAVTMDIYM